MPADYLALQQEQATEQECQVDPFASCTANAAEARMAGKQLVDGQAAVVAQAVEQGWPGPGIDLIAPGEHLLQAVEQARGRPWPMVHLQRKTQEHKGISDHGRVEQISPNPTKGLLADADGSTCRDHRQPPRGERGQGVNYVDLDSESDVLTNGISLILLNIGMYFVVPAIVIYKIRDKILDFP